MSEECFNKSAADLLFMRGEYEKAAKMYLDGARMGDAEAAFDYGYCLWRGYGVEMNKKEAKSFFVFARDMQGGEACYNLAMMYMRGEGVGKNYKKAFSYMRMSAEEGCIEAQLYLGMAYTSGCIFDPDVIGISLIPHHTPEYRDPYMALDGDVDDFEQDEEERYAAVNQDATSALEWFRKAAYHKPDYVEDLLAKGMYLYARCYVDGLGTDFDREKSTRLMFLASDNGSEEAKLYIAENGLTKDMLSGSGRARLLGKK